MNVCSRLPSVGQQPTTVLPSTRHASSSGSAYGYPIRRYSVFSVFTHTLPGHRLSGRPPQRSLQLIRCAVSSRTTEDVHIQLATAKLPSDINTSTFAGKMYQWAATLTSSGRNMPFALPIKADKLDNGFELNLLRIKNGTPQSVGELVATVEEEPGVGNVFFVRLYEGPASDLVVNSNAKSGKERLKVLVGALIDVPLIMNTMGIAIKQAAVQSR